MRNTLILTSVVFILLAVYLFIIKKDNSGQESIKIGDRAFMINDADAIDVITIKNPGYPLMHFKRQSKDKWILNEKYKADANIISNMLGVLTSMKIKYIPPASMMPKILADLPKVGIEIKCYDADANIISDFVMGSNDIKEGATFCLNKGADQAYAMHVLVAEGGLRNYFNQTQSDLRDKSLFDLNYEKIQMLKVNYFKDRKNSFLISKANGTYKIEAVEKFNTSITDYNPKTIKSYLADYSTVVAEAIRTGEVMADSIQQLIPFARINYTMEDKTTGQYDFYPMIDLLVDTINTQSYADLNNVERHFVFDDKGDVFIVQQRMLQGFFRPIEYFLN